MHLTPEEQAQAFALALLHKTNRLITATLKASAPMPLKARKAPEQFKPGIRREAPTPRGHGRRKTFAPS